MPAPKNPKTAPAKLRNNQRPLKTIPGRHGGTLLAGGKPGNKGGGRTPDEFKAMCRRVISRDKVFEEVLKIVDSPDRYPNLYNGAVKWLSEYGYGKPKESLEVSVDLSLASLIAASLTK